MNYRNPSDPLFRGATVWLTGLSAAGKTTVARAAVARLRAGGESAFVLDGDEVREGLCGDLGFSADDRDENVRRVAHVARMMAQRGELVIVALVSPYRGHRAVARELHEVAGVPFLEVFVDAPLVECERRDPKGLYRRARAGEIPKFTGIDDPYEPPLSPDLTLRSAEDTLEGMCERLVALAGSVRWAEQIAV